ncbi:MAG: hypothetical protein HY036_06760 [Nitrospirae bacterium]|nr:hypothetical protein [Nitrospirota bacterium]
MGKVLKIFIGAGLLLGLTLFSQVYAMEAEETSTPDTTETRDIDATSEVDHSPDGEVGEIEVENESGPDVLDHDSAAAEAQEPSGIETPDQGGAGETTETPDATP